MRNVLKSNDEVIHFWANRVQPSGRASSVSFNGDELFSYAACIAKLYDHNGRTYAVHADRTWSMTTSHHQGRARNSGRHHVYLTVPNPRDRASGQMDEVRDAAMELMYKAKRARTMKDHHLGAAAEMISHFNLYAEIRGEECRIIAGNLEELQAAYHARKAEQARQEKARQAQYLIDQAEEIENWRKGIRHYAIHGIAPMLRLNGDKVETSWGANIPVTDALKLWPLVKRIKRTGNGYAFTHPSQDTHLGLYRLNSINADGSIVVGCHTIAYSELEIIANALKLSFEVEQEAA